MLKLFYCFIFTAILSLSLADEAYESELLDRVRRDISQAGEQLFEEAQASKFLNELTDETSNMLSRVTRAVAKPSANFSQLVNNLMTLGWQLAITVWPYLKVVIKAAIPYVIRSLIWLRNKL